MQFDATSEGRLPHPVRLPHSESLVTQLAWNAGLELLLIHGLQLILRNKVDGIVSDVIHRRYLCAIQAQQRAVVVCDAEIEPGEQGKGPGLSQELGMLVCDAKQEVDVLPHPPTWDVFRVPGPLLPLAACVDHDAVGLNMIHGADNRAGPEAAQPMLVPLQLPAVKRPAGGFELQGGWALRPQG